MTLCGLGRNPAVVDVKAVSGSSQSVLAYAASTEPGYVAAFPKPLVVSARGFQRAGASVRYRCTSPGCRFAASIQPDDVKRVDPQTYEVRVRDASASLRPTLATESPGTFEVEVRPVVRAGERAGALAHFTLTAR